LLRSLSSRSLKMSAMATNFTGPRLTESALAAAPPPRPPQPIRAIWIRSLPAAWTAGMATLAKAETAANLPAVSMNLRRVVEVSLEKFMAVQTLRNVSLPSRGRAEEIPDARYTILA